MKTAILYASNHGQTRKVAELVLGQFENSIPIFDVAHLMDEPKLEEYNLVLFFCPTYGDEELQSDMENFLRRSRFDLQGKFFAICELGSYYGYEEFSFGALRILRTELLRRNGRELCQPLSLDSFPRFDSRHLLDWIDYLKGKANEN